MYIDNNKPGKSSDGLEGIKDKERCITDILKRFVAQRNADAADKSAMVSEKFLLSWTGWSSVLVNVQKIAGTSASIMQAPPTHSESVRAPSVADANQLGS